MLDRSIRSPKRNWPLRGKKSETPPSGSRAFQVNAPMNQGTPLECETIRVRVKHPGETIANTQQKPRTSDQNFVSIAKARMNLLGMAAHDLRHPVGAILVYSEVLAEEARESLNSEHVELLSTIQSLCEFTLRLISDTLEFADSESETDEPFTKPVKVNEIVAKCVSISTPLASRKSISLNFGQKGEPVRVLASTLKLSRVFNNLIENAIKYCQPGARIDVHVTRNAKRVLVSVRDNGPGISESDQEKLFTPYQRTRANSTSEERGTGLGLAIAKNIVDIHGGLIWVESVAGEGTTFFVALPAISGERLVDTKNPEAVAL